MRRMGIHMPEPVITVCTTKHRGYALTGKYANIHYLSRSFCHYRQLLSNCRVLLDSRHFTTITSHRLANANILPYNISDRNIGICVNIPRGGNSFLFLYTACVHACTHRMHRKPWYEPKGGDWSNLGNLSKLKLWCLPVLLIL